MATDVPLCRTAEQAARAFKLAGELGKGFADDGRKGGGGFSRHAEKFRTLWRLLAETLLELNREPFRSVEQACRELATCLHNVRGKLSDSQRRDYDGLPKLYRRPGGEAIPQPESYIDYAETLADASKRGTEALRSIEEPRTLAGRAFELADSLGRNFLADIANPTQFVRYRIPYGELFEILLDLREPMTNPRPDFAEFARALAAVVNAVRNVWRVLPESERQALRESRACLRHVASPTGEYTGEDYAEFGPAMSSAAGQGFAAMRSWQASWEAVDPFESFAEPTERANEPIDEAAFVESLLTGPTARDLSPRELALLEALLKRPVSFQRIQNEKRSGGRSPTADRQAKLKAVRNFNRALSRESRATADESETPEAMDPSRRIPSDGMPTSIGERLRIRRLAKAMFPDGLKIEGAEPEGPHYLDLLHCLRWYVGTPHERAVWNVYFDWSRPSEADLPLVDEAAADEGLTRQEYLARETLTEIRRFVRANDLPSPTSADIQPGVKVDSGHATGVALETADPQTDDSSSRNGKGKPGVKGRGATERTNDAEILRRRKAEPHGDLDALAEQCARDGLLRVESGQSLNRAIKLAMHRARNDARLARKSGSVHPSRAAGSRTKRRA